MTAETARDLLVACLPAGITFRRTRNPQDASERGKPSGLYTFIYFVSNYFRGGGERTVSRSLSYETGRNRLEERCITISVVCVVCHVPNNVWRTPNLDFTHNLFNFLFCYEQKGRAPAWHPWTLFSQQKRT